MDSAGYWLNRLRLSAQRSFEDEIAGYGVSVPQWFLLASLYAGDADSVGSLAAFIGTDKSAVSRSAHRLVLAGHIERLHGDDRRTNRLRLTRRGRRISEQLAEVSLRNEKRFFGALGPRQRASLRTAVAQLLEYADGVSPRGWLTGSE